MSEFKALRDEIAKIVAENKRKDTALQGQLDTVEQLRATIEQLSLENQRLKQDLARQGRHISYYENPHSPPSQDSIPARQKKAARRKDRGMTVITLWTNLAGLRKNCNATRGFDDMPPPKTFCRKVR